MLGFDRVYRRCLHVSVNHSGSFNLHNGQVETIASAGDLVRVAQWAIASGKYPFCIDTDGVNVETHQLRAEVRLSINIESG
jgi:hypothetical protein